VRVPAAPCDVDELADLVNVSANVILIVRPWVSCMPGETDPSRWRGAEMTVESPTLPTGLTRALCIVVFIVMLAALLYAVWIGITNYSRIHV
jgi:hypothetical protein